jgi:hypothetical protein
MHYFPGGGGGGGVFCVGVKKAVCIKNKSQKVIKIFFLATV